MTMLEIESLVKKFNESPESLTDNENELLYDACANFGQDLENIKSTRAIINLVKRFLEE